MKTIYMFKMKTCHRLYNFDLFIDFTSNIFLNTSVLHL